MAVRPAEFPPDEYVSPDPSGFYEVDGVKYRVNPRHLIAPEDYILWDLYVYAKQNILPEKGGSLSQPCLLMDAFEVLATEERRLTKGKR